MQLNPVRLKKLLFFGAFAIQALSSGSAAIAAEKGGALGQVPQSLWRHALF